MPDQIDAGVAWAIGDLKARGDALARRRRYYDGHHDTQIPDGESISLALRSLLSDLSDNMCDDVVDEPVSRLEVVSWTGKSNGARAQEMWDGNRMAGRSREVHRNAWMAGDGYLLVQKDRSGEVRKHPQRPEQIAVKYSEDAPDDLEAAGKVWLDGKRWRLNMLYPDGDAGVSEARLERWATRGLSPNGGIPEPRAFVLLGRDTEPDWKGRGILPLFHFPADEIGRYGRSALTDVIPLQDVLNKALVDLVVAMEDTALPQRFAIGVQVEYNPDGTKKDTMRRAAAGRMLTSASKASDVSLGQFDAANLIQLLEVQVAHRMEIARKGYLPAFSITPAGGTPPTGISLIVQEGRQTKRCLAAITDWTPEWLASMAYGLTLDGIPTMPDDLEMEWGPVQTRDEAAFWEIAALKQDAGVPKRQLMIEGGYAEEDVDEWLEEAADEAAAIGGGRLSPPGAGLPGKALPLPVPPPAKP